VCRTIYLLTVFSFLAPLALAQSSLTIDKLERKSIDQVPKEVAFSTVLEGTVSSPDLIVSVLAYQPHLKGWRLFPADIERTPEVPGRYRWQALCQFGELDGRGKGDQYLVRAIAMDPSSLAVPTRKKVGETAVITLKRVK
jgi:hypothetical protein